MQNLDTKTSPLNYELPLTVKKEVLKKRTEIKIQRNGQSSVEVTHELVEVDIPINRRAITCTRNETKVIPRSEQVSIEHSSNLVAEVLLSDVKAYSELKTQNLLITFFALLMDQAKFKGNERPGNVLEWIQHMNVESTAKMLSERLAHNFKHLSGQSSEAIRSRLEDAIRTAKAILTVRK